MLRPTAGLTAADLQAVADLERRVVAADGGRLKLEWETLEGRSGELVEDLLWEDGGRLQGFLGLYAYGGAVELAGMVAPSARRRGIATALLDAAMALVAGREPLQVLLVVPGSSTAGRQLAVARGGVLDHSEHALVLRGAPAPGATDPLVTLRRATPGDAAVLGPLLEAAFGQPATMLAERLASDRERTLVIERDAAPVGTVRLTLSRGQGGIYGFAVAPELQGRGIGRDVLRRVCRLLLADGATQIGLEVAVDNEAALGLYTSTGFRRVAAEDYYRLTRTLDSSPA